MFLLRIKNFISTLLAVLLVAVVMLLTRGIQSSRFPSLTGNRTFYLQSPSSQAWIREELTLLNQFLVKGESVVLPCENREETLAKIIEEYAAVLLFEECAGESVSYYFYTPEWTDGVTIDGVFVNLHVAFNGKQCAVGAPLIFGGF